MWPIAFVSLVLRFDSVASFDDLHLTSSATNRSVKMLAPHTAPTISIARFGKTLADVEAEVRLSEASAREVRRLLCCCCCCEVKIDPGPDTSVGVEAGAGAGAGTGAGVGAGADAVAGGAASLLLL